MKEIFLMSPWQEIYYFLGSLFFLIGSCVGIVFLYLLIKLHSLRNRIENEVESLFTEIRKDFRNLKQKILETWFVLAKAPQLFKRIFQKVRKEKK